MDTPNLIHVKDILEEDCCMIDAVRAIAEDYFTFELAPGKLFCRCKLVQILKIVSVIDHVIASNTSSFVRNG